MMTSLKYNFWSNDSQLVEFEACYWLGLTWRMQLHITINAIRWADQCSYLTTRSKNILQTFVENDDSIIPTDDSISNLRFPSLLPWNMNQRLEVGRVQWHSHYWWCLNDRWRHPDQSCRNVNNVFMVVVKHSIRHWFHLLVSRPTTTMTCHLLAIGNSLPRVQECRFGCDAAENSRHVILQCPHFNPSRVPLQYFFRQQNLHFDVQTALGQNPSIPVALQYKIRDKLVKFITSSNILQML